MKTIFNAVTTIGILKLLINIDLIPNMIKQISRGFNITSAFFEEQAMKERNVMTFICNDCYNSYDVDSPIDAESCPHCGSCDNNELIGLRLLDDIESFPDGI